MLRIAKALSSTSLRSLANDAREVRRDVLRMIHHAKSGNPGSALSCVEILTWLLRHEMHVDGREPRWPLRDRLVLSKGHAAPVFYSLAAKIGWIAANELLGFRRFNSRLQTHPEYDTLPCVDYTSGSLGQGLSAANGMAIAARYLRSAEPRFFVLLGDGELQEGQVWEAAMTAGHYCLGNVIAVVDRNCFQGDRAVQAEMDIEPLADKWRAFKWAVASVNGHDYAALATALSGLQSESEKPKLIIAETVKGRGVSFMENNNNWHVGGPKFTDELLAQALSELKE